jgi:uncharacterized membrane protein YgdD (TMEM256/DUF423 family)
MHKPFFITACFSGALSVATGAFGAHALKELVPDIALATFETGVRYQFYHSFALLFVAISYQKFRTKLMKMAGRLFITGMVLFCGSLYLLTFLHPGYRWIGAVTPFGGLAFIAGWILMGIAVMKVK